MSDWIENHVNILMDGATKWDGGKRRGLNYYLNKIIENQIEIMELLEKLIIANNKDK